MQKTWNATSKHGGLPKQSFILTRPGGSCRPSPVSMHSNAIDRSKSCRLHRISGGRIFFAMGMRGMLPCFFGSTFCKGGCSGRALHPRLRCQSRTNISNSKQVETKRPSKLRCGCTQPKRRIGIRVRMSTIRLAGLHKFHYSCDFRKICISVPFLFSSSLHALARAPDLILKKYAVNIRHACSFQKPWTIAARALVREIK